MSKKQKKPKRRAPAPAKKVRRQTPPRHSRRRIPPSPVVFTPAGADIGHTRESFERTGMMPPDISERMQPHPTLSRNDSKDPKGDIISAKIARIRPDELDPIPGAVMVNTYRVAKVEERFTTVYDGKSLGEAQFEHNVKSDEVSTGWWVVLDGMPVAMCAGSAKPALEPGDFVEQIIRKVQS